MVFDPAASFEDNLARFKAECEQLDAECAKILFDNLAALMPEGDADRTRQSVQEFNQVVLAALRALP